MSTTSPPPNANPPETPPSTSSPPPQSPPPAVPAAPPPSTVSPPPVASSPPPTTVISPPPGQAVSPPPSTDSPPPSTNSTPPPPPSATPPQSSPSPPPPIAKPPIISPSPPASTPPEASPPPPPTSNPPASSPPPPASKPPTNSPPPPPPANSPPPPASKPPANSPPPPEPPKNSPPPPSSVPPQNSPPPPTSNPPQNSPPPPTTKPPESSPPPPPTSKPPGNSPPPPTTKPPESSPPPPPASKPPENSPPPPASKPSPPPPSSDPPTPSKSPPPPPPPQSAPPNASPSPPIIRSSPPSSVVSPPSSLPSPPSPTDTSVSPGGSVSPNLPGNNDNNTVAIAAISGVVGVLVISLIGLLFWCLMKRKRKASGLNGGYVMPSPYGSSPKSDASFLKPHSSAPLVGSGSGSDFLSSPADPGRMGYSRSLYTYEELLVATNGFSTQNLLGEGGFGSVYKGCLPDGREIAVKQLKIGGGQGEREFKAEVEIISRIHHRHLVTLVGYCIADSRKLLIYEYVPNDTLYFHLHGQGQPVMDWARRVKIAAGAARGIAYLHEDCHPRVIHRDIKSSNILLDTNFEAKVSDFGLAKLAMDADTHISTRVMGTFGYMAPEYASSGKLTEKSDVYSFGVVLLELITGRKSVDSSQPMGDESLVEWARPLLSDAIDSEQFDSIADSRLENNYIKSEMFQMIQAAAACVRHSAVKRPRMGQVVRALDSMVASDLMNGVRPGQSEVYNSAQQSEEIRIFRRMAFDNQNYSTEYFSQTRLQGEDHTGSTSLHST